MRFEIKVWKQFGIFVVQIQTGARWYLLEMTGNNLSWFFNGPPISPGGEFGHIKWLNFLRMQPVGTTDDCYVDENAGLAIPAGEYLLVKSLFSSFLSHRDVVENDLFPSGRFV